MLKKYFLFAFLFSIPCVGNTRPPPTIVPIEIYSSFEYSQECPEDTPFLGTLFEKMGDSTINKKLLGCYACQYAEPMKIEEGHEKDFDHCQNRTTIQGYSVVKKVCPSNSPVQTVYDGCLSCNELNGQLADCSFCSNTIISPNGKCYSCNTATTFFTREECQKCTNRKYIDGKCKNNLG